MEYDIESILEKYEDNYNPGPRPMNQGPRNMAQGGRMEFQFGGGADAQRMGTEASRVFFKNRAVDKPTPTFEGGTGKAKVTNAKFKNPTQEKEYIKILEDRFKFPKGSKEARKVASNADISKKFGISLNNVERVNKALINKLDLKYPTQTYEGYEKIQRDRDKIRKENIKKTSSTGVESKIKRDIKKVDPTALANDVDIAHRASLKANANMGSKYLVSSLGLDSKVVNQSIVKPIEQKLGTLYELQKKLIKGLEPGNISKEKQLQIEKLNKKISELADRTKGTLQGVLIDEKTLKPIIYGVDYSKTLGFGLVNKPVSELTQADRDLIKLNVGEQIKAAKKVNSKNTGMMLSSNPFFDPSLMSKVISDIGKGINVGLGPTGMIALTKYLEPEGGYDLSRTGDRLGFEAEAALAKPLVSGAVSVTDKIKNPMLRKIAERAALAGMSPAMAIKVASRLSPVGIASLAGEAVYKIGKLGYEDQKRFDALSPEEQAAERAEQEKFAFDVEGS